jgi:hypothetical protein
MTENVEGQVPSEEEQPPVTPAPVSESESAQLSQQDSQDVVSRGEFDQALAELRGVQGKQDKLEHQFDTQFERTARELGMEMTDAQKLELRLRNLESKSPVPEPVVSGDEQANVDKAEVTPEVQAQIDKAVSEALKLAPSGASAVSPSGGNTPSRDVNAEEAAKELAELRASKPTSQRSSQEIERADELMQIMEEAD